jgi:hypothetical protein
MSVVPYCDYFEGCLPSSGTYLLLDPERGPLPFSTPNAAPYPSLSPSSVYPERSHTYSYHPFLVFREE